MYSGLTEASLLGPYEENGGLVVPRHTRLGVTLYWHVFLEQRNTGTSSASDITSPAYLASPATCTDMSPPPALPSTQTPSARTGYGHPLTGK